MAMEINVMWNISIIHNRIASVGYLEEKKGNYHIVSECSKIEKKNEYKIKHDWVGKDHFFMTWRLGLTLINEKKNVISLILPFQRKTEWR